MRCSADPRSSQKREFVTILVLQRTTPLRFVLRCVREALQTPGTATKQETLMLVRGSCLCGAIGYEAC
jgi:hypothetical protein